MSISILGCGSMMPDMVQTNDDLAKFLDTNDEWIRTRTGIARRHIMQNDETVTQLALGAAQRALDDAGIVPQQLDYILCATMVGDYITPSLACLVQQGLGAACPALDVNAACTGFIYGLDMAAGLLAAGRAKHILLLAAEGLSRLVDWEDRATAVLFGDAAAAVVLGPGDDLRYLEVTSQGDAVPLNISFPRGNFPGRVPGGPPTMHMDGGEIYKFAVGTICDGVQRALAASGLAMDDIGHVLLHQANLRIIDAARRRFKLPAEKSPVIIAETGNISAVSIPMLLDVGRQRGWYAPGEWLVLSAFGGGLTTGTAVLRWKHAE